MTSSNREHSQTEQTQVVFSFTEQQQDTLFTELKTKRGILSHSDILQLCNEHQVSELELLKACVPVASLFSVAPISKFYVGAVALGITEQGDRQFYFGANVEFSHQALSLVVHAEQSAINNAWLNGASRIVKIAISDAPCGYCRQFMNELNTADSLDIHLPERDFTLRELLPNAFGPKDLGNKVSLLSSASQAVNFIDVDNIDQKLVMTASNSYVPYTSNYSAVKIATYEHGDFYGGYAENAAYSPSLSPLQSALSQLYLAGVAFTGENVESISLLETQGAENQLEVTKSVLASFDFSPAFEHITVALSE